MSKPAARLGDPTVHGGTVVMGAPTVLIGGAPAARVGDMHVCPMMNPGPAPHVGGPVTMGSTGVFICGMPAARAGDMCTCAGPPDTIAMGCPTVLIGEVGGGGGGGGGAGAARTAQAAPVRRGAPVAGTLATAARGAAGQGPAQGEAEGEEETHFLDVKFLDKGGFPLCDLRYDLKYPSGEVTKGVLAGRLKCTGIEAGSYEIQLRAIHHANWSVAEASVGDEVTLTAETSGLEAGTPATVRIFARDNKRPDRLLHTLESQVSGDKIEAKWTFRVEDALPEEDERRPARAYSTPSYYFLVVAGDCMAQSGVLRYKDWIEIKLVDDEGKPIGNAKYKLRMPTGEIREGELDAQGQARVERIPPGKVEVTFDLRGQST